jgi:23S rRNA pseudouridine1911/1915/1917 synthase
MSDSLQTQSTPTPSEESSDLESPDLESPDLETPDETISLTVENPGRLDSILAEQITYFSRSRLQKLISEGHVTVNDRPCTDKKTQVKLNDYLEITVPPTEPMTLPAEDIPLDILYEDSSIIIINKPAGMVVHPAPGHSSGTLVNALLFHCAAKGETLPGINGVQRPGIVHRLDKDTTGAIVIAKTEQALHHLQAQFKTKTARRSYRGIVYGSPKADEGTINAPIGRHLRERQKQAIIPEDAGGRSAITHWKVQERLGYFTSLEYELETGRTHQIRVHTTHIGYPIIGDPLYGAGKNLVKVNLTGQALHAWRLRLIHPVTEEWIEAIAPIPKTMETLAEVLRKRARSQ